VTEVEVRNFQSVEHATFRVEGFTAIAGRSNIGKSALVRALKAALTGSTGTDFVRHGPTCARRLKGAKACKCYCSVSIKRENFDLLWEKGDGVNRYTFNGQVYDSVGSGTPSFLMDGYAPIKIGDSKELLQVSDQFDPIFLLNQTGGVIADVLSDVAHLDSVNIAMRMVEKDRREFTSTRKVRERDVVLLTQDLVRYDGLDVAVGQIRGVEDKLGKVEQLDKRLRQIELFLEAGAARATEIKHLSGIEKVPEPDVKPVQEGAKGFLSIQGWHDSLVTFKVWFERMKGLDAFAAPSVTPLKERLMGFNGVVELAGRYDILTMDVTKLEAVQGVVTETLSPSALKERLVGLSKVAGLASSYEALTSELSGLEATHQRVQEDVEVIQAEWAALGVCPTCEQPCGGHVASV
jgi:energy-coupling factor transporter ATP-binding protein EcfA2